MSLLHEHSQLYYLYNICLFIFPWLWKVKGIICKDGGWGWEGGVMGVFEVVPKGEETLKVIILSIKKIY